MNVRKMGLHLTRIEFDLEAERDQRGSMMLPVGRIPDIPAKIERVWGSARIYSTKSEEFNSGQLERLAEQVHARCPVANLMSSGGCEMNIEWTVTQIHEGPEI